MKQYLTVKQVCSLLPIGKTLVYQLVQSGEIPSAKLGGKILIPETELEALLDARRSAVEAPVKEKAKPVERRRVKKDTDGNNLDMW